MIAANHALRSSLLVAGSVLLVASAASDARADGADAAARSTARRLGQEAVKLYGAGEYGKALEKFNTADSLVPTPTLGLYAARCLAKLGRLVEASERYLDVSRMKIDASAPAVMRKARVDAIAEREQLLKTLPTLEVTVVGPVGDGVKIALDGKPMAEGFLGEKRPIDPGAHHLEAKRADASISEDVTVDLGQAKVVALKLPPLPPPPPKPVAKTPLLRTVGWAALGVGAAGVTFGFVTGFVAVAQGQSLAKDCPNHVCTDPAVLARAHGYDTSRALSTSGFVVGGVGLAAGIPLVLLTPKAVMVMPDAPTKDQVRVEPFIGPLGAGVRGQF